MPEKMPLEQMFAYNVEHALGDSKLLTVNDCLIMFTIGIDDKQRIQIVGPWTDDKLTPSCKERTTQVLEACVEGLKKEFQIST